MTELTQLSPDRERALFSTIFDVAGCLVVVLDREGRILLFNQACERLTGYTFDEIKHEHVWNRLLVPEEVEAVKSVFEELRGDNSSSEYENYWVTKTGERRLIHWSNTSLTGEDGKVEYVIGTGIDVTESSRIRDALSEREARLQAILETAVEGIITVNDRGIIESVNPGTTRIFGYDSGDLIGHNVNVLMPSPYRENHDQYIANYLKTGERKIIGVGREVEGRRKDGTVFSLDIAVSEVNVRGKRLFTGIVRDITERKRLEEQARLRLNELAHASRLLELGEMASGITHEVNQPLAAIVSFAEASLRMLKAGKGSSEPIRDALEQIASQGARAGEIIHRLRRFARKGETQRETIDINALIRGVLELVEHDIQRNRIEVTLELDNTLLDIEADRIQIEQVCLNVLRNAIEAMAMSDPGDRQLTVRTGYANGDGRDISVSVSDTGVGLPEDELERVFDTFYTTKPNGMGVGLAISRSIIHSHGGRLWAAANPEGGASFHFTLPSKSEES